MSAPANLTFTQIETRVANQLRINTSNAAEIAKIDAVINEVYRDIYLKADWWFLRKRAIINTRAKYTTGTVNVSNGSVTATLSGAPAVGLGSFEGGKLVVIGDTNDNNALYRIESHTAGSTTLTLDAAFTGTTNPTASYRIYFDEYDVHFDVGKMLKVIVYGMDTNVERIGYEDMGNLKTGSDLTEGKPRVYTLNDFFITGLTTGHPQDGGLRRMVVHPYPDRTYRIETSYKQQLNTELSGSTQPLIPDEYRHVLIYGALAIGYPIFLADAERGQIFTAKFNDTLNLMAAAHREYGQERPQFTPFETDRIRNRTQRGHWHRGRISLGNYFDTHPSQF